MLPWTYDPQPILLCSGTPEKIADCNGSPVGLLLSCNELNVKLNMLPGFLILCSSWQCMRL